LIIIFNYLSITKFLQKKEMIGGLALKTPLLNQLKSTTVTTNMTSSKPLVLSIFTIF